MHYTGTIWRPPYEASSLLLEVTAGCTHHKCKFCTLYADLPFQFRMSPLNDIESDLLEVQTLRYNPASQMTARLRGLQCPQPIERVFLTLRFKNRPFADNRTINSHIYSVCHINWLFCTHHGFCK